MVGALVSFLPTVAKHREQGSTLSPSLSPYSLSPSSLPQRSQSLGGGVHVDVPFRAEHSVS